jgi:hypothetical protein
VTGRHLEYGATHGRAFPHSYDPARSGTTDIEGEWFMIQVAKRHLNSQPRGCFVENMLRPMFPDHHLTPALSPISWRRGRRIAASSLNAPQDIDVFYRAPRRLRCRGNAERRGPMLSGFCDSLFHFPFLAFSPGSFIAGASIELVRARVDSDEQMPVPLRRVILTRYA